jgi:alpha-N-arabinofuranosidase
MTNENGTLRNTIFYPYAWALKYAHGASLSLAPQGPAYEVNKLGGPIESGGLPIPGFGAVTYLDITASYDAEKKAATLFILNRDLNKARDLEIKWHDLTPSAVTEFATLTGSDLKAMNTFADPKKVVPQTLEKPAVGSTMRVQVPARSYSVLALNI